MGAIILTDAPRSAAKDSFSRTHVDDQDICNFVGLVRGMIIDVGCPPAQRQAGGDLFRTVVQRVYDIEVP